LLKTLRRNILRFVGFRRVRTTMIGSVANMNNKRLCKHIDDMRSLGRVAA
jgi:hypothetical protein